MYDMWYVEMHKCYLIHCGFFEQKSDIIIHLESNIVIQMKYDIIQGHPFQVSRWFLGSITMFIKKLIKWCFGGKLVDVKKFQNRWKWKN
jgi:hypothetical protein